MMALTMAATHPRRRGVRQMTRPRADGPTELPPRVEIINYKASYLRM